MAMQKNSQLRDVIGYLEENGSITRAEGLTYLGIANMPAVICELRNKYGYDIRTEDIGFKTRHGKNSTYARWVKNW